MLPLGMCLTFIILEIIDNKRRKNDIESRTITLRWREEKINILYAFIRLSHIVRYEEEKIGRWVYDNITGEEYRHYIETLSMHYNSRDPRFRDTIDGIVARNIDDRDPWWTYNLVNAYHHNNMYYTSTNWIWYEEVLSWEIPQFPYTDVRAQSSIEAPSLWDLQTSSSTMTTSNWQWEIENQWITSFQYYQTSQDLKKEKKKIDPNKEIIKHLTKICKNKKWA